MERVTSHPIRVLVVEDDPNDQDLLHHQLRKTAFGEHVLFFSDPRRALATLREPGSADLRAGLLALFLDVNLPHMSGIDLLRKLRGIEDLDGVPVIIMTTNPHPDTRAACQELNVAFIAEKPVTVTQFAKVLADLFNQGRSAAA